MRTSRLIALAVVVVVVCVSVGAVVVSRWERSRLGTAFGYLPGSVLRASYTDWRAVDEAVGESDVEATLQGAFDRDLDSVSVLSSVFAALDDDLGIGPRQSEWEVYGQARDGAVAMLRLRDDVDLDALSERIDDLGYVRQDELWVGSAELVQALPSPLSDVQQNLAVVEDKHLLVMSDATAYLSAALEAVAGSAKTLDAVEHVGDLEDAAGEPAAAMLWAGDFVCEDLAMSRADPSESARADRLVEEAGGVNPLSGFLMAEDADGVLTMAFAFADDDQAAEDLQPRTDLASGDAPGQGGSFTDRFTLTSGTASGSIVTLRGEPVDGGVLGDLDQGPVLPATC